MPEKKKKCIVCGQDWEKIMVSGRCARCEAEFRSKQPPPKERIAWELDGTITESENEQSKKE
jgi:DNA-directed RNA polymerase subunit RPC12/RpoP